MDGPAFDPVLALRWLFRARRGALAVQVLLMVVAEAGTDLHVHSPALLLVLSGWIAVDVVETIWVRSRTPPDWLVLAHGAVDLVLLTAVLALSGGARSPLVAGYLVYLALLAVVLPPRRAWLVCLASMAAQAAVALHHGNLPGLSSQDLPTGELLGHIVAFDLAALAVTWVVSKLADSLVQREVLELETQRRRATTERLAALGTLAAGVAHELGTPLGTIQLLAEESRRESVGAERMSEVLDQVDRCRRILDRLRANDPSGPVECALDVAGWLGEWNRAGSDVVVSVQDERLDVRIVGSDASWRAAVWVALDNARRAGARHVEVEVRHHAAVVEVRIRDDGRGLDAEEATRVGEPFRTGWDGTGLGVFSARTFAQSVGGDFVVAPAPGRGAEVILRMPRATL